MGDMLEKVFGCSLSHGFKEIGWEYLISLISVYIIEQLVEVDYEL